MERRAVALVAALLVAGLQGAAAQLRPAAGSVCGEVTTECIFDGPLTCSSVACTAIDVNGAGAACGVYPTTCLVFPPTLPNPCVSQPCVVGMLADWILTVTFTTGPDANSASNAPLTAGFNANVITELGTIVPSVDVDGAGYYERDTGATETVSFPLVNVGGSLTAFFTAGNGNQWEFRDIRYTLINSDGVVAQSNIPPLLTVVDGTTVFENVVASNGVYLNTNCPRPQPDPCGSQAYFTIDLTT